MLLQLKSPKTPGPETVVLVDDGENILALIDAQLGERGKQVLTALTPKRALELFREQHQRIDAAIVDYLMPRTKGVELIRQLLRINDVDAYLTSGHSRGAISDPEISSLFNGFISRPFIGEDLQSALAGDSPNKPAA